MQRPTEIHHPLRFSKTKRPMNRMRRHVFQRRIGRQLSATLSGRPRLDRCDQRACHAIATRSGLDIQPLEKRDRRTIRAVDVVRALRRFNEGYRRTIRRDRKANEVPTDDGISHVAQVLTFGAIGPQE